MGKVSWIVRFIAVGLCSVSALSAAETREHMLGDMDGIHYDGPGSVDDVYVDPVNIAYLRTVAPHEPNDDFDVLNANNNVPFTFLFDLGDDEVIAAASLTLGFRATDSLVTSDWFVLPDEDPSVQYVYRFQDLGWLPVGFTGVTVRSLDLSDVLGDDRLYLLADGDLTAYVTDDTAVDYAKLTIVVIPEPAALALLTLGGLALLRRRKNGPGKP